VIRGRGAVAATLADVKLLRYGRFGEERPAVLVADGRAIDVGDLVDDFDQRFFATGGIDRLRRALAGDAARTEIDLDGQRIGAPIAKPYLVIGIGLNYADHAAETGAAIPTEPVVFNKAPSR
jgi:2,4-didehydro-3-deoxy-L-rhamnonate hydrolase